jgi:maltose alpha-D-glucosyltransferase/alpha-amylase
MKRSRSDTGLVPNPEWYKDAVIYEIPIRGYADSNADGVGDIEGLISKLDYVEDLGVDAIWLLPFYPSPLRDGGYDISDYTSVHPMYGTLPDFKRLLREAHARGIRVITELVINHTSRAHAWFERARRSPKGSKARDFYVWSDDPKRFSDVRIIFKDFENSNWTWDPVAGAYYWHRFYSHQPDLNFDNPAVCDAVFKLLDFWLGMGVDGLRLDAVPYLYERDDTTCENLPETHAFLRRLRAHVDQKFADRMLLAEANMWPEDAAAYFGAGDECHMNFHFPLMPRMFISLELEDRFPIADILRQTPAIPKNCQWATFLRNHDELTLEMVTDEDRDYMYRAYARESLARLNLGIRRRLAPLLKTRDKIELLNGLLFSLPGTPVLYYGDEIGMGDNVYLGDRDGVRTPMQWSADRNAGFSSANPQQLYLPVITDPEYRYEAVNVQAQQANPTSLLWWMKRIIAQRKQSRALRQGELELLHPSNSKIFAFLRSIEDETVLVVANLSRFHQWVELELSRFEGLVPIEMSGLAHFPAITGSPYRLSLSPHGFIWFRLERRGTARLTGEQAPHARARGDWLELLSPEPSPLLERAVLAYVRERRWFRSKSREPKQGRIAEVVEFGNAGGRHALLLFDVEFDDASPETYVVPLVFVPEGELAELKNRSPEALIAFIDGASPGALFDGLVTGHSLEPLVDAMLGRSVGRSAEGRLGGAAHALLGEARDRGELVPRQRDIEQTNSVVNLGDRVLFKLFRRAEPGVNSELEIGTFFTEEHRSVPVPRTLGSLGYRKRTGESSVIALAQEFVPSEGTAWSLALQRIERFCDEILAHPPSDAPPPPAKGYLARARAGPPPLVRDLATGFLADVQLLGRRTAELHLVLASDDENSAFVPEPFSAMHANSIYQWSHALLSRTCEQLSRRLSDLPERARKHAQQMVEKERTIDELLRRVTRQRISVQRIRCHGDLHLGQVLHTGTDFVFIDWEGEPGRTLEQRRYKRVALRDVMGMARSFGYASETVMRSGRFRAADVEKLEPWVDVWRDAVASAYLGAYLETAGQAPFVAKTDAENELLLGFYELEKVIYEVYYELNNRPDWLDIPLTGLVRLVARES